VKAFHALLMASGIALLSACATYEPQLGATRDEVRSRWGEPTGAYPLPAGMQRLEFASGPYGRTTWMVDVQPDGRVQAARQVLNEAEFLNVQIAAARGLSRDELLQLIGRPGERRHGGWQGGQVWSWRYPTNDCLWFQVSITDQGQVRDGAYGVDPACDTPPDARD